MNSWYTIIKENSNDNRTFTKTHIMVFETDDKDKAKEIEAFYKRMLPPIDNSYHRNIV